MALLAGFGADCFGAGTPFVAGLLFASEAAFAVLKGTIARTGRAGHGDAISAWAFVHGLVYLVLDKQIRPNDPTITALLGERR